MKPETMSLLELIEDQAEIDRLLKTIFELARENITDPNIEVLLLLQRHCPTLKYSERASGSRIDIVLTKNGKDVCWWFKDDEFPITLCTQDGGVEIDLPTELYADICELRK